MSIVYKVLNPLNGEYLSASTPEECIEFVADLAVNLLNNLTHNAPYSVVETTPEGAQIWRNPQGGEMINMEAFKAQAKLRVGKPLTSIERTPVETLP